MSGRKKTVAIFSLAALTILLLASSAAAEPQRFFTKKGYLVSTHRFFLEEAILVKGARPGPDNAWFREWASEIFVIKPGISCEVTDQTTWTGLVRIKAFTDGANPHGVLLWIKKEGLTSDPNAHEPKLADGRKT